MFIAIGDYLIKAPSGAQCYAAPQGARSPPPVNPGYKHYAPNGAEDTSWSQQI